MVGILVLVSVFVVPAASAQTELVTKAKKRVVIRDSGNTTVGILIDTGIGTCPTNECCNAPTIALEVQDVVPGVDETCSLYVCRDTLMGTDVLARPVKRSGWKLCVAETPGGGAEPAEAVFDPRCDASL